LDQDVTGNIPESLEEFSRDKKVTAAQTKQITERASK
jgi:hypothetical protein